MLVYDGAGAQPGYTDHHVTSLASTNWLTGRASYSEYWRLYSELVVLRVASSVVVCVDSEWLRFSELRVS